MKKSIYDIVHIFLKVNKNLRGSDMKLCWAIWKYEGGVVEQFNGTVYDEVLYKNEFLALTTPETITRARRRVQELHPELRSTKEVQESKNLKESKKGNFIFLKR